MNRSPGKEPSAIRRCDGLAGRAENEESDVGQVDGLSGDPGKEQFAIQQCDGLTRNPGKEQFEVGQVNGLTGSQGKEPCAIRQCAGWTGNPRKEPCEVGQVIRWIDWEPWIDRESRESQQEGQETTMRVKMGCLIISYPLDRRYFSWQYMGVPCCSGFLKLVFGSSGAEPKDSGG